MHTVPPDIAPHIAHRAVEWWLDLGSGAITPAQRKALDAWRAEHADHERAWQHIQTVSQRFQSLGQGASAHAARTALTRGVSRGRRSSVKALVALFFVGGATWSARHRLGWPGWSADMHTATGEIRTYAVDDGTALTLNTASSVDLRFSASERRIVLRRGEIMVVTGHRDGTHARPFVVQTAQGTATPLGTRFSVQQRQDDTRLAVFEGAVRIVPDDAPAATRTLHAGESTHFTAIAVGDVQAIANDASAWTQGMLVANDMRLGDFLGELARYREGVVRCDPRAASLRVSGTYLLADTDGVLDTLSRALPLRVDYLTRFWVTVSPARG
ncbi:FecR domain-containing protein [Paraburkholderia bannensis]|uniref:FecR domain-containing protein n=1 Tax=Paraburkholderia bannensis TaxID=765414 RepID=UPI002AB1996B|nr:FecR domain-containing protein [Paraburkholderia bannensis]